MAKIREWKYLTFKNMRVKELNPLFKRAKKKKKNTWCPECGGFHGTHEPGCSREPEEESTGRFLRHFRFSGWQ